MKIDLKNDNIKGKYKIMARILKNKELVNTKLATNYGGWMYCDTCNENIGYLCYSTYTNVIVEAMVGPY